MSPLVLDASAALRLLSSAPGRDAVRRELRDRVLSGDRLLVPAVFWSELIDGLSEGPRPSPDGVVEAIYQLQQLGVQTADAGRPGILAAVDAVGRGLSATQAAYLVLAESSDAVLLTADRRLAAVAGTRVRLVAGRPARAPTPDRSWARWKGAARYLRELRASL